jgi:hypothetical protein
MEADMGISGIGHVHGGGAVRRDVGGAGATGSDDSTNAAGAPGRHQHGAGADADGATDRTDAAAGAKHHAKRATGGAAGGGHHHRGAGRGRSAADGAGAGAQALGGAAAHGAHDGAHEANGADCPDMAGGSARTASTATIAEAVPTAAMITAARATAAVTDANDASGLLAAAAASLPNSDLAAQVLQDVQAGGAQVNVLSDATFAAKYGRALGVYDPNTNQISVPASIAANHAQARIVLLHEGLHWLQHNVQGGIDALGGAVGQALTGAGAMSTATPGTKAAQQQDESQAYLLEALAARQVGITDDGLGTSNAGAVNSYAQIQAAVRATPEYA